MPITGERVIMAMSQIGAPATLEEIARHLAKRSKQTFEAVLRDVTATITGGVLYKYIDSMNGHYFNRDNVNEMLKMLEVEEMDQKPQKKKPRKKKPRKRKPRARKKPIAAPVEFCSCVSKYCECPSSEGDSELFSVKDSQQSTNIHKKKSNSSVNREVSLETYDDNLLCPNLMDATKSSLKKQKDLDLVSIGSAKLEIGKIIDEIAGVIECQHKNTNTILMKRGAKRPYYKVNQSELVKDALEVKQNCYGSDKEEANSDCMPSSSKRAKLETSKALNKVLNEEEVYSCKFPETHKCDDPNAASTNKQ